MKKEVIREHFNKIADDYDRWKKKNRYYYSELKKFYASVIPENKDALEVGCGTGEILNCIRPRRGVGIDISEKMAAIAKGKYPHLSFVISQVENTPFEEKFDCIIMADVIDHLPDIWDAFTGLRKVLKEDTKIVITTINPAWGPILSLGEKLKLKMSEGPHNFISSIDLANLLELLDFKIEETGFKLLLPVRIPLISDVINRIIPEVPLLRNLCLLQYLIIKPKKVKKKEKSLSCSIIIPCHNEVKNIKKCIERVPQLGKYTEIIVVDDGSTDGTREIVEKMKKEEENVKLISYFPRRGKGFAVKSGFDVATGDVLITLDADMAVRPEELPRFFIPLNEEKAEFVNGTRMVYPVAEQAMRYLHLIGNKIFSIILSWLMGQRVTDTLCGTKALFKKDYRKIKMGRCPWADFDLLFGAAKLKLKIVEMSVHYQARTAGKSKMKTFKDGFLLLHMCFRGLKELKLGK